MMTAAVAVAPAALAAFAAPAVVPAFVAADFDAGAATNDALHRRVACKDCEQW